MYEKYLNLSMTGASTIQPNDVRSLLGPCVVPFNDYEAQYQFRNGLNEMQYGSVDRHCRKSDMHLIILNYIRSDVGLGLATRALKIPDRVIEMHHSQRLLGFIISKYLDRLDNRRYSLLLLHLSGQLLVLWAVRIAGTMYRVSGRRGEAITLLETVIHVVQQELDLKDAIIRFFYNRLLIELAHCCAEDGHRDEPSHLLHTKIIVPSAFNLIAHMQRCNRPFGLIDVNILKRRLRRSMRDVLKLVGRLENGRADTHVTQEHHERLQGGSCEPGTSEWGPFLTDCIEWDKI